MTATPPVCPFCGENKFEETGDCYQFACGSYHYLHNQREWKWARAIPCYERVEESLRAQLDAIGEYLWPNQTGLPNKHRDCLVAIKAREELMRASLAKARGGLEKLKDMIERDDPRQLKFARETLAQMK